MHLPFFINLQHKALLNYSVQVSARKIAVKDKTSYGFGDAIKLVNQEVDAYRLATKTLFGKLKSFIPRTTAYSLRISCAKQIISAYSLIKKIDSNVEELEKNRMPAKEVVVRSQSEGANELHRVYPSPLKRAKSSDNVQQVKSANAFSATPVLQQPH
jgi:hypothetical protein